MKFATLALLGAASAVQTKTQTQMLAEIEAMSMNANMHQIALREKTLLKSYLEVDMNEFLQGKLDSEMFEGINDVDKATFIGNFFHWVKCRFGDCSLAQKSKPTHEAKKAEAPVSQKPLATAEVKATSPTAKESAKKENAQDLKNWGSGKGNGTPAHSGKDAAPADKPPYPKFVQTDAQIKTEADSEKKQKITTNTSEQVAADLKAEANKELIKPKDAADNSKDQEPK